MKVGRGSRDRGLQADGEEGGHGRRDVPQAAGLGRGGRQRRGAAARRGKDGRGARAGAVQAGVDQAAHEVQGRGLHPVEGRGRAAHAVLHGVSAAVLHPDDGRDGVVEVAGRGRDGDAGRQHDDHGGAAHAGGAREGRALRDSRRRPHGRRRTITELSSNGSGSSSSQSDRTEERQDQTWQCSQTRSASA